MQRPKVAVLMAVYNGENHLQTAINSILAQTYKNFEFIIIDDGSTDQTKTILSAIQDPRVRVAHQENMGLAASLNRGISLTDCAYIARQDHDDISDIRRLEKQVMYLDDHHTCALLGTRAYILRDNRLISHAHDHPALSNTLKYELLFNNPFVHSSVMFRKDVVIELGGYSTSPNRQPPEDYELWSRIARKYDIANIAERLVIYRETPGSISRQGNNPFLEKLVTFSAENIAYAVGLDTPDIQCTNIAAFTHGALHRLIKPLDWKKMSDTLVTASHLFGAQSPPNSSENMIASLTQQRLDSLKHQYLQFEASLINKLRAS